MWSLIVTILSLTSFGVFAQANSNPLNTTLPSEVSSPEAISSSVPKCSSSIPEILVWEAGGGSTKSSTLSLNALGELCYSSYGCYSSNEKYLYTYPSDKMIKVKELISRTPPAPVQQTVLNQKCGMSLQLFIKGQKDVEPLAEYYSNLNPIALFQLEAEIWQKLYKNDVEFRNLDIRLNELSYKVQLTPNEDKELYQIRKNIVSIIQKYMPDSSCTFDTSNISLLSQLEQILDLNFVELSLELDIRHPTNLDSLFEKYESTIMDLSTIP